MHLELKTEEPPLSRQVIAQTSKNADQWQPQIARKTFQN